MIRVEIFASNSYGSCDQSAVMKSSVCTARNGDHVFIGAAVAHDADRLHRQQHRERLRRSCRYQPACFSSSSKMASAWRRTSSRSCGDGAEAAHRQAGAGERMPPDQLLRQTQFQAEAAHLVLEQVLERLDQLEAEFLRQAADVVVRLDVGGGAVDRGRRSRSRRDRACPGRGSWRSRCAGPRP